eukprot:scaffold8796_cov32-Tisochrysis_lutea.AAC.1
MKAQPGKKTRGTAEGCALAVQHTETRGRRVTNSATALRGRILAHSEIDDDLDLSELLQPSGLINGSWVAVEHCASEGHVGLAHPLGDEVKDGLVLKQTALGDPSFD